MQWHENEKRIRRYLRDPDENIWSDAFLRNAFNDSQFDFFLRVGMLESVDTLRVPPMFQMSYIHDWEWQHRDTAGRCFQALRIHHQSPKAFCFHWEAQAEGLTTDSDSDFGEMYTHPWEAWLCPTTPAEPAPLWFPHDFHSEKLVAWDQKPIDFISFKEMQSRDASWRTREGQPQHWYRLDSLSNEFRLYPQASSPDWDDITGSASEGTVLFTDFLTESGELGILADIQSLEASADVGGVTDTLRAEGNVLMIYNAKPRDVESADSENSYPDFLTKYIEYRAISQALAANTDGYIPSLVEYWNWRYETGVNLVRRYKMKRKQDRDYRLTTKGVPGRSARHRHPRLPDEYPAVW